MYGPLWCGAGSSSVVRGYEALATVQESLAAVCLGCRRVRTLPTGPCAGGRGRSWEGVGLCLCGCELITGNHGVSSAIPPAAES
eukprot:1442532-Prymnesium_polylepis.1